VDWVERFLAPELRPGDIVVTDNLSAHTVAGFRAALEAAGAALLYLLPCSPDFNLIEHSFARLKGLLHKTQARTLKALWRAIGLLLEQFSSSECERCIRHCSYCQSA
jgi:transposase